MTKIRACDLSDAGKRCCGAGQVCEVGIGGCVSERNHFAELTEGFEALKAERAGKITLRIVQVTRKPAAQISAKDVLALREKYRLSRPVFAHNLRTNPRTLENWEKGRAKPNAQAALLIRMVDRFPDMVQRLEAV
jgi:putative transcriptional regulator